MLEEEEFADGGTGRYRRARRFGVVADTARLDVGYFFEDGTKATAAAGKSGAGTGSKQDIENYLMKMTVKQTDLFRFVSNSFLSALSTVLVRSVTS